MNRSHCIGWKVALLGAAVLSVLAGVPVSAAETVRVLVNDVLLTLTPPAAVEDGVLYLPLRPLAEQFQAFLVVTPQSIEVRRADGEVLTLRIGRLEVWSGGVVIAVTEAPVRVVSGTTMIPRGAVDVLFDSLTIWNRQDGVVTIATRQTPAQTTTVERPPSMGPPASPVSAAPVRDFEPEFRPEVERPILASGYLTLGLSLGVETTATGRLQFRTHGSEDRTDGTVALAAGSSSLTAAGTIRVQRPADTLTVGGISVHDSPLTLYEQGLLGILYQTHVHGLAARFFGGNIVGTASQVYGVNVVLEPIGSWLLQATTLYDPALGTIVVKGRADRALQPGLSAFTEAAWGGSIGGSGTAWRAGLTVGTEVVSASLSYLSLNPGFPTVGNAALFAGRSGPMLELSYRPSPQWAFSASAATLRGTAPVPDRLVTSLLATYHPVPWIGIVGEMRTVEDATGGAPTRSTTGQLALTLTRGRWGWVLAGGTTQDASLSGGPSTATSTVSLRAGYTLLSGLPVWAEVSRSTGSTDAWGYGLGWTFRLNDTLDLNTQVRYKIYAAPSAYAESSLEVSVSHPLSSGAHLTLGGGLRYSTSTAAASPYLALQYGYPLYAYGPPQTGRLAAVMFIDRNGNGLRDPDEPGVGGVVLRVDGRTAARSDQDGTAAVGGVRAGEVTVSVDADTVPAHLVAAQTSQRVQVAATQTAGVEVALVPAAAVGGVVFFDENNNGVRDAGEKPAPGVVVRLLEADLFRTSDELGAFEFAQLPPGEYTLAVDQRSLALGVKVRGDGTTVVSLHPGTAVVVEVPLQGGKTIIRTFP